MPHHCQGTLPQLLLSEGVIPVTVGILRPYLMYLLEKLSILLAYRFLKVVLIVPSTARLWHTVIVLLPEALQGVNGQHNDVFSRA